jgi:hypothetical protein
MIPSGAESTLCLDIGKNVEQDNLDLETDLYAVMDPSSNTWCPLCYRTPVLVKLSIIVYKGLYPNTHTSLCTTALTPVLYATLALSLGCAVSCLDTLNCYEKH